MAIYVKDIEKAIRDIIKADSLSEKAHMNAFDIFNELKGLKTERITDRMHKVLDSLSNARQELGEAVYQLDKVLKEFT